MKDAALRPLHALKPLDRSADSAVQKPTAAAAAPAESFVPRQQGDRLASGAKAGTVAGAILTLPTLIEVAADLKTLKTAKEAVSAAKFTGLYVLALTVPTAIGGLVGSAIATSDSRFGNTVNGGVVAGGVGLGGGIVAGLLAAGMAKRYPGQTFAVVAAGGVITSGLGGAVGGFFGSK